MSTTAIRRRVVASLRLEVPNESVANAGVDGRVRMPSLRVGDDLLGDVDLTFVFPALEDVVVQADRKQDVHVDVGLAGSLALLAVILLANGAFDLAIDGRALQRRLAGNEHELIVHTDGLVDLSPKAPACTSVVIPLPAADTGSLKVVVQSAGELLVGCAVADEAGVEANRLADSSPEVGDLLIGKATATKERLGQVVFELEQRVDADGRWTVMINLIEAPSRGQVTVADSVPAEKSTAKVGRIQHDFMKGRHYQDGAAKVGSAEFGVIKVGVVKDGAAEVGVAKVGVEEICVKEASSAKVGTA